MKKHKLNELYSTPYSEKNNPVVKNCAKLVLIWGELNMGLAASSDLDALRNFISRDIKNIEFALKEIDVDPKVVHETTYCLCAVFDDLFERQTNNEQNKSYNIMQGLLVLFHNETHSNMKIYEIAEKIIEKNDINHFGVLTIIYQFLEYGYQGVLVSDRAGREKIESIKKNILELLTQSLITKPAKKANSKNNQGGFWFKIPLWVSWALAAMMIAFSYGSINNWVKKETLSITPQIEKLQTLSQHL